jgi:hypothetical protein
MPDSSDSTSTSLVIAFGILAIIVTVAGFHVRDSVFCSLFRGLHLTWTRSKFIRNSSYTSFDHTKAQRPIWRRLLERTLGDT